jgi:hypothetical protein
MPVPSKGQGPVAVVLLWEFIVRLFQGQVQDAEFLGLGVVLILFSWIWSIPAIGLAWLLHCAVVIVRTKSRNRTAAQTEVLKGR